MAESVVANLVSTVIPVYNRPAMLRQAVDSVLAQTHRPVEILISDDGSTDDTPQLAQQLVRDHPDIVRYVRNSNRGPGPAREAHAYPMSKAGRATSSVANGSTGASRRSRTSSAVRSAVTALGSPA